MAYNRDNQIFESISKLLGSQDNALMQNAQSGNRFQNLLSIAAMSARQNANPDSEMGRIMGGAANTYANNLVNKNQNQFRNAISAIHLNRQLDPISKMNGIMGVISAYGQNPEDYKDILDAYGKQIQYYMENAPVPLIDPQGQAVVDPNSGQPVMIPKGAKMQSQSSGGLAPSLQKAKDERVAALIQMSEENPMKIQQLDEAEAFLKTPGILQGRLGAINIKRLQETDPANPILGQWQNLKSILTNAQLDYVGSTKGAVSDREMALFGQAVANDDLISVARMMPQIRKIKNGIIARQNAAAKTFQKLYNEDPSSFANFNGGSSEDISSLSDEELKKIAGLA